jgi:hypothetical protein
MAIQTVTMRNSLATAYATAAAYGALYTTTPGGSAGTEVTGGSPAYARKPLSWGSASSSAVTATAAVFDVPASTTVVGFGIHSAVTAGNYLDGVAVTSQAFSGQGTYSVTPTFTMA